MLPTTPSWLSRLVARLRSTARGWLRRRDVEAEMDEEFRNHIELRARDLERGGLPPHDARRRAHVEFGHVERHKWDARAARGLDVVDRLGVSWLDVKLGVRMLLKYPGLSIVSVLGMAVAIAIGAGYFGFISALTDTTVPLDEGDRLVALQNTDARNGSPQRRALHDFLVWREALGRVDDVSAYVSDSRTMVVPDGAAELVRIARMSASGFRVARVAPLLGRPLIDADEVPGAPDVLVIAFEEWQERFDGDPEIIGRTLRLGTTPHTVVGVMPAGFRFPVSHRYWVPLRLDPSAYEVGSGPSIEIFGRLADGATLAGARGELTALGRARAEAMPETHAHLRPRVLPYTHPYFDIDTPGMVWALRAARLSASLLVVLVAINVAVLVYARTTARTEEITVRCALGASRARVVSQLFAEALVVSIVAATLGLTLAGATLQGIEAFLQASGDGSFPFWFDLGLSPGLVAYVAGLAVLAGVIVGVVPALRATGGLRGGLQALPSRGSRARLGRTWTGLIVLQVAVAVAGLPYALHVTATSLERGVAAPGYAAHEMLRAYLSIEREETPLSADAEAYEREIAARFVGSATELVRRLEAEPAISAATFAVGFPGQEGGARVQIEGSDGWTWARAGRVDPDLFRTFGVPLLAGRDFEASDVEGSATAIIVDEVLAARLLGGGAPLGRRLRVVTPSRDVPGEVDTGPWLEVVGVAPQFTVPSDFDPPNPTFYRATRLPYDPGLQLVVRVRSGTPAGALARRVRDVTASVDPALQLHRLRTAADAERERQQSLLWLAVAVAAVTLSVLLLSAGGIHAMMSFTVTRQRREIGIRTALGASPRRLLTGVFARAGGQLGSGALVGLVLAASIGRVAGARPLTRETLPLVSAVVAVVVIVGLAAALGPARQGLAVDPTEALRED